MSRKFTRLVLAASVAASFTVAPMLAAGAAETAVSVEDDSFNGGEKNKDIYLGDTVRWELSANAQNAHTVTPQNGRPGGNTWPDNAKPSGELEKGKPFAYKFDKPGRFFYYCEIHPDTMSGYFVDVIDPNATTTTTTAPAQITTTTTRPAVTPPPGPTTTTTSAPASSAGTKPPGSAAPAPSTTTTKPDKDKKKDDKPKEEETTTTTVTAPPAPVDIPDSAIIPVLPGSQTGTTTQNGIEAPTSAPEGDAIALLKTNKGGGKAKKLLLVSGLGLGVLGLGAAGYKWSNRSSRYFPA